MRDLLVGQRLVAILTIEKSEDAVPLAAAIIEGGISAIEITFRTDKAIKSIREILFNLPEAMVGAGTIISEDQLSIAEDLGCNFMVSPGATGSLLKAANDLSIPLLPGISTISEIMCAMEYGYRDFKFFPAELAGGAAFIKSLINLFPDAMFCPTGGVGIQNMSGYLRLPNVLAVGGSWIAPPELIRNKQWFQIEKLAREAAALCAN